MHSRSCGEPRSEEENENLRLKSAGIGEKSTLDLPPSPEGTRNEFAALCFARDHKKNSLNRLCCVKYVKEALSHNPIRHMHCMYASSQ